MSSDPVTFLTGATGTVGREHLVRMIRQPDTRVICLVRADSPEGAERRLTEALDSMTHCPLSGAQRARITALRGDVTQDRLGLDLKQWEALAAETTRIVHGAANVSWSLPLEEARRINVG